MSDYMAPLPQWEQGEPVPLERLEAIPIFGDVPRELLEKNQSYLVLRKFKKGEAVCREGEHGSTAFYVLSGVCRVYATPNIFQARKEAAERRFSLGGSLKKLCKKLFPVSKKSDSQKAIGTPKHMGGLKEGDFFGEMTCLNSYPRPATIVATEDCEILEMMSAPLKMLIKKSRLFLEGQKAQLSSEYHRRALENHLRGVEIFRGLPDAFFVHLTERMERVRLEPGEVLLKEGEVHDYFCMISQGFIKISSTHPGGDLVLAYLRKGDFFGEAGIIMEDRVGTTTCTVLDYAEILRISNSDFFSLLERYKDVRDKLEAVAAKREETQYILAQRASQVPLDEFLAEGLMRAQNVLLIDLQKCTRCDQCVKACADIHDGMSRLIREGLRYDNFLVATSCRACMDPVCMIGCPVGSIRRRDSLEVIIEDWCIGCGLCAKNCPYGNISMQEYKVSVKSPEDQAKRLWVTKNIATNCDLCENLKEPGCVYACPHEAAFRVNPMEFFNPDEKEEV